MTTLDRRARNRALLARQLLLERSERPVLDAVEHLGGLQAQAPLAPYAGLWARLAGFRPALLAGALLDRQVVRLALMRSTVHLVTAPDCLAVRPLVAPVLDRALAATDGRRLAGADRGAVTTAARHIVEDRPCTGAQLGALLHERWPEHDPEALASAARAWLPLVQLPPRGVWGRGGLPVLTTAEAWLGRAVPPPLTVDGLVLRDLAAFGPAGVLDVQTWSGLARLGEVVDRLRPGLVAFRDEAGGELFDLPDAPRPGPDVAAPARLLPEYDNLLVSHRDRSHVIPAADRERFTATGAFGLGSVLVDGSYRGTWRISRTPGTATLVVTPFRGLSGRDEAAVVREGGQLLAFAAADRSHDVRIAGT